jgi:hypothetical protein
MYRSALLYTLVVTVLAIADVGSTRYLLSRQMGAEANPTRPIELIGMALVEVLIVALGVALFGSAVRLQHLLWQPEPPRTARLFFQRLNSSLWAGVPLVALLAALLLVWIKITGVANNLLMAATGYGIYDRVREICPEVGEAAFYWLFTTINNIVFLLAATGLVLLVWKRSGWLVPNAGGKSIPG